VKHVFRHVAEQTRARPEAMERIQRRLVAEIGDAAEVRARLAVVPTVADGAEDRVMARLAASQRQLRPHPARVAVLGTLLAAAVALFAIQEQPVELTGALSATEWRHVQPTPLVALSFQGEGALGGNEGAPHIEWRAGTLKVEVEPNRGVKLDVQTREALVRVVGTGFSVDRSALGTTVAVSHGRVSVACEGGGDSMLGAGEHTVCMPTTPAGLLGRARALTEQGAPGSDVLATVDRGLSAAKPGAVHEELAVARAEALAGEERWSEAYAEASQLLAEGAGARRDDLLHLRARYGFAAEGCRGAADDLRAFYAAGQASYDELVVLADCVGSADVVLAHDVLVSASALATTDEERANVAARRPVQ